MTRLAVVISHPIQYFSPLFQRLAAAPGVDLRVFYCCDWGVRAYRDPGFDATFSWDVPLLDGHDHEFLPIARRPAALGFREVDNPLVGERLARFAPDAVWIHGYGQRTQWRAWLWARGRARRIFFGDSELLHPRPLATRLVKGVALPRFFRGIDAFITIGDSNEAYYRAYGVPAGKFFRGAYPIDVERFRSAAAAVTPELRAASRRRLGLLPGATVVAYAGKLTPLKRPFDLVEAVGRLQADPGVAVQALLIGAGPLEARLREQAARAGAGAAVRFAGFVNQGAMPGMLALADAVALCSEIEPYGVALTEGMACGCAALASDRVGCVGPTSAARPGVNALVHRCGDVAGLAANIRALAADRAVLARMQAASRELAASQDASAVAAAVRRALDSLGGGSRRTEAA
jgi:glycosyltransferase involved in cell wall biosynthesis